MAIIEEISCRKVKFMKSLQHLQGTIQRWLTNYSWKRLVIWFYNSSISENVDSYFRSSSPVWFRWYIVNLSVRANESIWAWKHSRSAMMSECEGWNRQCYSVTSRLHYPCERSRTRIYHNWNKICIVSYDKRVVCMFYLRDKIIHRWKKTISVGLSVFSVWFLW